MPRLLGTDTIQTNTKRGQLGVHSLAFGQVFAKNQCCARQCKQENYVGFVSFVHVGDPRFPIMKQNARATANRKLLFVLLRLYPSLCSRGEKMSW